MRIKRELAYFTPRTQERGGYVLALEETEIEPGWIPFAVQETRLEDGKHLSPADAAYREGKFAVFVWLRSEDSTQDRDPARKRP